jgi:hypothetical protein
MLAAAPSEQQKQLLGERLFPLVANVQVRWLRVELCGPRLQRHLQPLVLFYPTAAGPGGQDHWHAPGDGQLW